MLNGRRCGRGRCGPGVQARPGERFGEVQDGLPLRPAYLREDNASHRGAAPTALSVRIGEACEAVVEAGHPATTAAKIVMQPVTRARSRPRVADPEARSICRMARPAIRRQIRRAPTSRATRSSVSPCTSNHHVRIAPALARFFSGYPASRAPNYRQHHPRQQCFGVLGLGPFDGGEVMVGTGQVVAVQRVARAPKRP